MKRFSMFLIVAAAMMLCAGFVAAQPPHGGMMRRGEGAPMDKSFSEQLGLSDQQKEQIRQVMLDTRKKNIDVEAKQKLAGIELHELIGADTPDQNKINAKISELSKLHETLMRNRIESHLAVQKLLTPEQRKKAKDLRPLMREHRGGFRHFQGGGPGMMRSGGLGFGPGFDIPFDEPEHEEEL
jgi:Spy/CpxP family protein refolding chaperone